VPSITSGAGVAVVALREVLASRLEERGRKRGG
jgi:ribose 1,5-bisphosphokinase PhnN